MKYIDLWGIGFQIKPDEKEFKESVIALLCDQFCHEDITIILTQDITTIPVLGKNVIVFLSANELSRTPYYFSSVGLIYTDFWNPSMPKNMRPFPLGLNERTTGRFFTQKKLLPLSQRKIDISFIGSRHGNDTHRPVMLDAVNAITKFSKHIETYTAFFHEQQKDKNTTANKISNYFEVLHNSKISLCPGGGQSIGEGYFPGWESYRLNESLKAGNLIITNFNWSPWYTGPNMFYVSKWKDLNTDFIENILNQDIDKIQKDSVLYYREKLSRVAILNSVVADIENHLTSI
jgi:hypothetical protein